MTLNPVHPQLHLPPHPAVQISASGPLAPYHPDQKYWASSQAPPSPITPYVSAIHKSYQYHVDPNPSFLQFSWPQFHPHHWSSTSVPGPLPVLRGDRVKRWTPRQLPPILRQTVREDRETERKQRDDTLELETTTLPPQVKGQPGLYMKRPHLSPLSTLYPTAWHRPWEHKMVQSQWTAHQRGRQDKQPAAAGSLAPRA